jgi:hypothetical protein
MSSQIINEIKEDIKINGINYIKTYNNKEIRDTFSYINEKKYDDFLSWLEDYEYNKSYKCCFTDKSITDPIKQFVNAMQSFNKYGC